MCCTLILLLHIVYACADQHSSKCLRVACVCIASSEFWRQYLWYVPSLATPLSAFLGPSAWSTRTQTVEGGWRLILTATRTIATFRDWDRWTLGQQSSECHSNTGLILRLFPPHGCIRHTHGLKICACANLHNWLYSACAYTYLPGYKCAAHFLFLIGEVIKLLKYVIILNCKLWTFEILWSAKWCSVELQMKLIFCFELDILYW